MTACKICGNTTQNKMYTAEERMFGFGGAFEYMECSECGCVQLLNIPEDLGKYYPADKYYSYNSSVAQKKDSALSNKIREVQAAHLLLHKHRLIGSLLCLGYNPPYLQWLKKVGVSLNDAVLDVGCGGGDLLFRMRRNGFTNLTGTDPFNTTEIHHNSVDIYTKNIFELDGSFDFIMINHAYEHMENPLKVLKRLYQLLRPKSYLLIRIPVANAYCWKHYGVYWAPLDAPRHLYIHSEKSMKLLSEQAGFEMRDIIHDGTAFQFWGSEQYKRGINLKAPNSYDVDKSKSIFSKAEIRKFKQRVKALNAQHLGGEAQFYLYKA